MFERRIFDWLVSRCDSFQLKHDAHRDANTTAARHLLHRERLGDTLHFVDDLGRSAVIKADSLWELSLRNRDGTELHIVDVSLDSCLEWAMASLETREARRLAA